MLEALLTDTLPHPGTRARDLALVNAVLAVPFAPVLDWLVLTGAGSYRTLFAVTGTLGFIGGLLILRVRHHR